MSRARLLTIAVISLLVINIVTLSCMFMMMKGNGGHGPPPPHGEGPKRLIIARLGFDEAQVSAYELIIDEHRSKSRELQEASRQLHNDLYSLLKEKNVDHAAAQALMDAIAQNQKATDQVNFDHFQKIKDICKGPQVEKFNVLAGDLARLFAHGPH